MGIQVFKERMIYMIYLLICLSILSVIYAQEECLSASNAESKFWKGIKASSDLRVLMRNQENQINEMVESGVNFFNQYSMFLSKEFSVCLGEIDGKAFISELFTMIFDSKCLFIVQTIENSAQGNTNTEAPKTTSNSSVRDIIKVGNEAIQNFSRNSSSVNFGSLANTLQNVLKNAGRFGNIFDSANSKTLGNKNTTAIPVNRPTLATPVEISDTARSSIESSDMWNSFDLENFINNTILPTVREASNGLSNLDSNLTNIINNNNNNLTSINATGINSTALSGIRHNVTISLDNVFVGNLSTMQSLDFSDICSVANAFLPCTIDRIFPVLQKAMEKSGSCCSGFLNPYIENYGMNMGSFYSSLGENAANLFCSKQEPGFDGRASQTCLFSLLRGLFDPTSPFLENLKRIILFLQIPNSEGCNAFTGKPFTSTTGEKDQILYKKLAYSACSQTLDSIVSWVQKFPYLRKISLFNSTLSSIFDDGKCLKLDENFCLHIPSGFSSNCNFKDKIELNYQKTLSSPAPPTSSPSTNSPEATTPSFCLPVSPPLVSLVVPILLTSLLCIYM